MKIRCSIILFFLFAATTIFSQNNYWQLVGPGAGSDLKSIAIQPNNPDVLYVGGDIEGIFKTTNGGTTWMPLNNNLAWDSYSPDVYWVQEIVFDPNDPTYQTLYICTVIGLFKTTNGGEDWERLLPTSLNTEEDYVTTSYVAVDPANSNVLFAGSGTTWTDEDGKGVIYKSTDGGSYWEEIQVSSSITATIHGIFIDSNSPEGNRIIYASTSTGVYKSNDNGTTWNAINNGLPQTNARRLKGIYSNGQLNLFLTLATAGTPGDPNSFNGGIYQSTDEGVSWISINGDLPKYQQGENLFYYYWKFAVHPNNINTLYIATTRGWPDEGSSAYEEWGIYKTTNGGGSWTNTSNNIEYDWMAPGFFDEIYGFVLEMAPSDPNIIYWGLDWMKKTIDAGESWFQINSTKVGDAWKTNGLGLMAVDNIAFSNSDPDLIFVGFDDYGIFRSTDGGNSFKPLDPVQDPYDGYDALRDLIVDPGNGDLYISRWEGLAGSLESNGALGQVWMSTNNGDAFTKISNGLPDGRPSLILDKNPGSPGNRTLFCAIKNKGIYKTTNSGGTWNLLFDESGNGNSKIRTIAIDPSNSNRIYAGLEAAGGMYGTNDGGNNWTHLNSFPAEDVLTIEIDNSGNIFVGSTNNYDYSTQGALRKSTDFGDTWEMLLDNPRVAEIEIDPANPDLIFIISQAWYLYLPGVENGVFYSDNGGTTWNDITYSLPNTFTTVLKQNPFNMSQLYVGTNGGGLFKLDDFVISLREKSDVVPAGFELYQNYPNPFNPSTVISFTVAQSSPTSPRPSPYQGEGVVLRVFDVLGNEVATLVNENLQPGYYEYTFEASNLSSGIYLASLKINGNVEVKKMVFLK